MRLDSNYLADAAVLPVGVISPIRRKAWFRWVALLALVCTIGLYAAESSHHHDTQAGELLCPVCQVIAHGTLDLFVPEFADLLPHHSGYLISSAGPPTFFLPSVVSVRPHSRAPPAWPITP
ncbi:MAG: hypothetical protein ACYDDO_14985 [Acidiferrobacterales bacterium]